MKRFFILAVIAIAFWPVSAFAQTMSPYQKQIFQARDRVLPALVHIQPVVVDYLTGREKKLSLVGSGVIISRDGYVVTNYHVAGKAERIICTLYDRDQVPATLVGGDAATDLAVIKLNLDEYQGKIAYAELGDSDSLQVGQTVLAMGSPLALSRSVSMGVISTVDRYFPGEIRLPSGEKTGLYNTWLQTDAAINPGNSGGPLVDLSGKIVGINTRGAIFAENIAFSIPVNVVKRVVKALIDSGHVRRSWIGVYAQPLQDLEQFFGTGMNRGVLVASVDPGSPAERAGLKSGDIILKFNGIDVSARFEEELPHFYQLVAQAPIGKPIPVVTLVDNEEQVLTVTPQALGESMGRDYDFARWRFTAKAITNQMALDSRLPDTLGIYVTQTKAPGPAFDAGLRRGDIIRKVNNKPVNNLDELIQAYESLKDDEKVLLTTHRNEAVRYVLLEIEKEFNTGEDESENPDFNTID
jgi:serine protease Do